MKRMRAAVGGAVLLLVAAAPALGAWTRPARLGRAGALNSIGLPQVAVSGSTVHALWFSGGADKEVVLYARSRDCGASWSSPITLAQRDEPKSLGWASLAVSGSSVHVTWWERGHQPNRHTSLDVKASISYSRSLDGGKSWSVNRKLFGPKVLYDGRLVGARGSEVWLLWKMRRQLTLLGRSQDGGSTWSFKKLFLDGRTFRAIFAAVPSDLGGLAPFQVAVSDYDRSVIHHLTSDGRSMWTPGAARLEPRIKDGDREPDSDGGDVWPVGLLVSEGSIDLLWVYAQSFKYGYFWQDVFHQRSEDGGPWSRRRRVNARNTEAWGSAFASGRRDLHAAWVEASRDLLLLDVLVVARSRDGGRSWRRKRFQTGNSDATYVPPAIAVSRDVAGSCRATVHLLHEVESGDRSSLVYRRHPRSLN